MSKKKDGPKILVLDIESLPIIGYCWGLWDQNVGLNQIKQDWAILSFACKWLGEKETFYFDQKGKRDIYDDKAIVKKVWKFIDESDIIITQNGVKFDIKKLNARFVIHGMKPPSSFKQIDTLKLAKKHFGFTSNKLAYMTEKLCVKYKKLEHKKFPGFELWSACIDKNPEAFKELKVYNIHDILATEELYTKLIPWDSAVNFNIYRNDLKTLCTCGSSEFNKNGFFYSSTGKYQRYSCKACGAEHRDRTTVLTKEKKKSLKGRTSR